MKCLTDSAMELTWPGVPVMACASMRPLRSKMPAERSPASRTMAENAVRNSVCACSSTTAMSRFHMICSSMSPIGLDMTLASLYGRLGREHQGTARIDAHVEAGRRIGGSAFLDDEGRSRDRRPGLEVAPLKHRHADALAERGVEHAACADCRHWRARWRGCEPGWWLGWSCRQHHPAHNLDQRI